MIQRLDFGGFIPLRWEVLSRYAAAAFTGFEPPHCKAGLPGAVDAG